MSRHQLKSALLVVLLVGLTPRPVSVAQEFPFDLAGEKLRLEITVTAKKWVWQFEYPRNPMGTIGRRITLPRD